MVFVTVREAQARVKFIRWFLIYQVKEEMDSPICQNAIDKLNKYTIVINNERNETIANNINFIKALKREDFDNGNNQYEPHRQYKINVWSNDIRIANMTITLLEMYKIVLENGKKIRRGHLALYIDVVHSKLKGLGKSLIYLATCKAVELNLPIALMAMPSLRDRSLKDKVAPGRPESVIREEQGKLLRYYNSLGFNRSGNEEYTTNYGLTQYYESQPENILIRAANAERNEFERRTPANWARLQEEQGSIRGRGGSRGKLTRKNRVRRRRITRK